MFDNVGRNLDEGAGKRTLVSALATLIAGGVIFLAMFIYGSYWLVTTGVDLLLEDEDMVEVDMADPDLEEAPPPPPPPLT